MSQFTLPHFGQINLTSLQEYADVKVEFQNTQIQIDLNFSNHTIGVDTMENVKNFIENIDQFDQQNKANIVTDYNNPDGEMVKEYLEHHLEEIGKHELSALIDFDNPNIDPSMQLLGKLNLVRLGLYPSDNDNFAIFDYTIGRNFTNYLVSVTLNKQGNFEYMAMES